MAYQSQEMTVFESEEEYQEHLALAKTRTAEIVDRAREYLQPLGIAPEFFAQATVTALMKNVKLLKADKDSFKLALLKCAQCGLMPDGESAVLVPFKKNVTLIKMYGGMLDIIRRNIPGIGVECSVVWEWDDFEIAKGDDARLLHAPRELPADLDLKAYEDWSRIKGAYCVISLPPMVPGALPVKERYWMPRSQIERIRNRAPGSHVPGSPWKEWPAQMCEKTVMRQAFRRLPSRSQIFAAVNSLDLDDYTARTVRVQAQPAAGLLPPARPALESGAAGEAGAPAPPDSEPPKAVIV